MIQLPISVLIITYKRNSFLFECLNSLLKQKYVPQEIIVIDNNGDASTESIINKYKSLGVATRYFKSSSNNISHARNVAMEFASNNYVAYLDDDCLVCSNWIKKIFDILRKDSSYIYYGGSKNVYINNSVSTFEFNKIEYFFQQLRRKIGNKMISLLLDTKNCFFDKKIFLDNNITFDEHFLRLEDLDISYRLSEKSISIQYIDTIFVKHRYRRTIVEFIIHDFQTGYYSGMIWDKYHIKQNHIQSLNIFKKDSSFFLYRIISSLSLNLGMFFYRCTFMYFDKVYK